jgi:hypothetical protein
MKHCPHCGGALPLETTETSPAVRAFRSATEKLPRKSPSGEYRLDLIDSDPPSKDPSK